jgi:tyrosine-protein kinase Etk/Wzc
MRASLKYTSAGDYQTICATSTIPGEGKTFVLINLAAVHALLEKKVLIIDLDLRKPRISKSFKLSNSSRNE